MAMKRVIEASPTPSLPTKSMRASSSASDPSQGRGKSSAFPLLLPSSTYGLWFTNEEQRLKYEQLSTRITCEPNFSKWILWELWDYWMMWVLYLKMWVDLIILGYNVFLMISWFPSYLAHCMLIEMSLIREMRYWWHLECLTVISKWACIISMNSSICWFILMSTIMCPLGGDPTSLSWA